jgi:glycosyltransferase involved in cell wall biosynthesis
MNILYINANSRNRLSDLAGYATHMAKTIKGFECAGHRVTKFLAGDAQKAEQVKQAYRKMSRFMPRSVAKAVRDFYEVTHDRRLYHDWLPKAEDGNFRFVYERMNALHVCGRRLARRLGVPFVLEINDPLRETVTVDLSPLGRRYAIRLEDRLVRESDCIVVGSEELKKYYVGRGFSPEKFLVLYPTADLDLFGANVDPGGTRAELGLEGKVVAGFVAGNLAAPWRRTDLLMSALSIIAQQRPEFRGLVVGDRGPDEAATGSNGSMTGGSIVATGKVPYAQVPRFINAMDICVIPNATWYGSPTKLFEYGAMAKAVVAPRLPPIQEVIEHGVSGLLFEPNNKDEMIQQILSLLENPARREKLGKNFRHAISTRYTWKRNTEAVIKAVERC